MIRKQKQPNDTEILALAQQAYESAVVIFTDLVSTQPRCAERKVVEPLALVAAGYIVGIRYKNMSDEEFERMLLTTTETVADIAENPKTWRTLDRYIDSLAKPQRRSPERFFQRLTPVSALRGFGGPLGAGLS